MLHYCKYYFCQCSFCSIMCQMSDVLFGCRTLHTLLPVTAILGELINLHHTMDIKAGDKYNHLWRSPSKVAV